MPGSTREKAKPLPSARRDRETGFAAHLDRVEVVIEPEELPGCEGLEKVPDRGRRLRDRGNMRVGGLDVETPAIVLVGVDYPARSPAASASGAGPGFIPIPTGAAPCLPLRPRRGDNVARHSGDGPHLQ